MTDLKELLLTRLSLYDTTLDLSESAPIVAQVVNPVVSLFEKDPLGVDIQSFLVAKIEEAFPDIKLTAGDALFDILVTSISLFFEVYRREVSRIANSQSIANIDTLSDEDADALAANWLVDRNMGRPSTCVVRVIFSKPVNVRIDSETVFSTPEGDLFVPNGAHEMSATAMVDYQLASREYYYDVDVISLFVGSDQNIDAGKITAVSGLSNVSSVTNITAATGGKDKEENRELLLTKIPKSISERSLVTVRGIVAKILNTFSSIRDIQVVGFGDIEMERDAVNIDGLGAVKSMGFSFVHRTLTKAIVCPISLSSSKIMEGDTLLLALLPKDNGSDLAESKHAFKVKKVDSYTSNSILPRTGTYICDIEPIVEGDLIEVAVQNDEWLAGYSTVHEIETVYLGGESFKEEVHIGGKADIYVFPEEDVDDSIQLDIKPSTLISTGVGVSTYGSNKVGLLLTPPDDGRLFEVGSYLSIGASNSQTYYKIRHVEIDGWIVYCYLDRFVVSAASPDLPVRWSLFRELDLNASSDREVYLPSVAGQRFFVTAIIGSNVLRPTAPLNLATYGISFNENSPVFYIDINIGSGTFVSQITGFSQDKIELSTNMPLTGADLEIEIYTLVTSIALPLTHINSINYGPQLDNPLPYGRSLGCKILYVGGARENQNGLLGFVAPKYHEMFGKSSTTLLPSMDMDMDSYQMLVGNSYSTLGAANTSRNNLPFSFGMGTPSENSVVLRYEYSNQGTKHYSEFLVPSELFIPGDYNIFIGVGNYSFSDIKEYITSGGDFPFELNMEYPIQGSRGDILTIDSGPNSGSYIIDHVYQVPVYLGDLYTDGDISTYAIEEIDPQAVDLGVRDINKSKIFKLSIVRIFGSFKSSPLAMFESSFELDAQFPSPVGLSDLDGSISVEAALAMLMDPSKLIRKTNSELSDSLEDAVRLRLGAIPVDATAALAINLVKNLMPSCYESYSTGNPSSGKGRIYLEGSSPVRLSAPRNPFIAHSEVNTSLNEASSGNSISRHFKSKDFFYLEFNGLRYAVRSDRMSLELIYSPEGVDLNNPLSWDRRLDISNVGSDLPEGLYIPSNINLDGRNAIEISSTEDTYGVDIIRLPEDYGSSINRVGLDQSESLLIHHEASKPFSNFFESESLELFFVVVPGDTPTSFSLDGQDLHSYLYIRGGIPYIEPELWEAPFSPPFLLTSGRQWGAEFAEEWYNSREAGVRLTLGDLSLNDLVVLPLREVEDISGHVRVDGEIIGASSVELYTNSYGQSVYDLFTEVLRLDPEAMIILFSPTLNLPPAPGLVGSINDYLIQTSLYRFKRAKEIDSGVPDCGLLAGTTSRGSNIIHFPSKFSSVEERFPLDASDIGSMLFIDQGPDQGGYTILDVDSQSRNVSIDSALTMSTAEMDARGVATIDLEAPSNNKVYISGTEKVEVYSDGGIVKRRVASPNNDFSLPFHGVTSRIPTSLDVGKYLTLYSFVRRPDHPNYPVEEVPFTPVREHLGSFKIVGVDIERVIEAGTGDSEVLSATLTLETSISTSFVSPIDERYLETYFIISPDTIPPETDEIKGFVPVHVYESEPTEYKLIGQYLDMAYETRDLAISTRGYSTPSAVSAVGPFIRYNGLADGETFVNIGMDLKNPFTLVRSGYKNLIPDGSEGNFRYVDIDIQSIGFEEEYNLQTQNMFTTYGEEIDGYSVTSSKDDDAFSEDEDVLIRVPGVLDVTSSGMDIGFMHLIDQDTLEVKYRHSPDTQAVQHFSNKTSERVVCSHIRSKRMLPAYFGLDMSFFGGVNPRDVATTVKSIINNSVLTRTPFSSSDLIHAAHLRGVSRVQTPISMYYLVIDKGRRRHLRFIDTEFSPFTLANYQGSIRTTSLYVTGLNKQTLGVQLNISPAANAIIGGV